MHILADTAMQTVDYCAIGGYMILMILVGVLCSSISKNISDYIRMGAKSTWWLAGLSIWMASFSVATFTGYAGQGYVAGWSIVVHYWCVAFLFIVQAAFFAPWMRRTRAITPPDAIRLRFGGTIEQISVYTGLMGAFVWGGVFLWSLATFCSTVFGMPINVVIIIVGIVILFYSVAGGSWSVQITDNLQALMLIPMTVVMAVLALKQVGGIGGLLEQINLQGLEKDFAFLKGANHQYTSDVGKIKAEYFTVPWLIGMLATQFIAAANVRSCYRYLSIKTGSEARKAALLAGVLTLVSSFFWVIPAIVGRLKFAADIEAVDLKYPADGAYAVVASKLLPPGMLGLIVVAMFSAAMSSLDSNLTGSAGLLTRNVYQPLARALGYKPLEGKKLLLLTKIVNFGLGIWAIVCALLFAKHGGGGGIFNVMTMILALVGIPTGMPFVVSFLMRRVPVWGPVVGMVFGAGASIFMKFFAKDMLYGGRAPYWHEIVMIVGAFSLIPTILTRAFWYTASDSFRARVDHFFEEIHRPVDVEEELGGDVDQSHLKTVGGLGLLMAAFLSPLVVYAFVMGEDKITSGFASLAVFGFVFVVSGLMYLSGRKAASLTKQMEDQREELAIAAETEYREAADD